MDIRGFRIPLITRILIGTAVIWPLVALAIENIAYRFLDVTTECSNDVLSGLPTCDRQAAYNTVSWIVLPRIHLWVIVLAALALLISNRQWLAKEPVCETSFSSRLTVIISLTDAFLLFLLRGF